MLTPSRKLPDWIPVREGDSRTEVASEDGFLNVTVKALDRDNTDCYVEGRIDGELMGGASVEGVGNGADWPNWENSFMAPVYKGARWEVKFHKDPLHARAYPMIYIRWTPLGSLSGPDAEAWQIVRDSSSAELFEQCPEGVYTS
jgi:hypothetical protein